MAENIVISFEADTSKLQPAVDGINAVTGADKALETQFKKGSDAMNAQLVVATDKSKIAKVSLDQMSQSVRDLNKEALGIGAGSQQLKKFADEVTKAATTGKTLVTQLRAMKQELALMEQAGNAGTKAFDKLAIQAAKLEDQIGDTAQRIRVMASDTFALDAGISIVQGLAGAFAAAQGAVGLLAGENEDLQKALLKVQSSMAILAGLQQVVNTLQKQSPAIVGLQTAAQAAYTFVVGTSTGALKLFRIALAATGIGLIILAVAALVANWDKLTGAIGGVSKNQQKLNEINSKAIEQYAEEKTALDLIVSRATNLSLSYNERAKAVKELNELSPSYLGNLTAENIATEEGTAALEKFSKALFLKAQIEGASQAIAENTKQILLDQAKIAQTSYTTTNRLVDQLSFGLLGNISAMRDAKGEVKELTGQNDFLNTTIKGLNESLAELGGDPDSTVGKLTDQAVKGSIAYFQQKVSDLQKELESKTIPGTQAYKEKLDELSQAFRDLAEAEEAGKQARGDNVLETLNKSATALPDPEEDPEVLYQRAVTEKIGETLQDRIDRESERIKEANIEKIEAAAQVANRLFEFSQALFDMEISNIEEKKNKGIISERQAAAEIAKIKRKQAIVDKAAAIFNIILNTALAVAKVAGQTGVGAVVAVPLMIALGAVQLATVLAQPIPKFAKGTKQAPPGFKLVGEQGPELIHDRGGYPIIPNKETQMILANWNVPSMNNIPDLPYISDATMTAMENFRMNGNGRMEIDYDKLADKMAERLGSEMEKHPRLNVTMDPNNVVKVVEQMGNKRKILDDYYSWNG